MDIIVKQPSKEALWCVICHHRLLWHTLWFSKRKKVVVPCRYDNSSPPCPCKCEYLLDCITEEI